MHTGYEPDRNFFRSLSSIKGYDGYLIGQLSFYRSCYYSSEREAPGEVRIRKQRKNYVILELWGEECVLAVTLFCPNNFSQQIESGKTATQRQEMEKNRLSENVIAKHSFAVSEIWDFVNFVGDANSIHRTAEPVVPGLLMAEWFFSVLPVFDWERVEIRFHIPAYAGQTLCLEKQSEKYMCFVEETGKILFSCIVCAVTQEGDHHIHGKSVFD